LNRIVYTLAVGSPKFAECALGLARSLQLIGDRTHRVIVTDLPNYPWHSCFDTVLAPEGPFEWTLFSKLCALDRTDADQVLFIDADCLVFRRLDSVFDYCAGRGLCVQGKFIESGDWYGRVTDHLATHGIESIPKFNGGMIYYERTDPCRMMLQRCFEEGQRHSDSGFVFDSQLIPEEPYVALAIAKMQDAEGSTHVIPDEQDFVNTATGLIGKLDLDVRRNRCSFVCRRFDVRFVEPTIFHASRYINFAIYWKQLDALAWLAKYEASHEFGFMSFWHRVQRSINRRYLKYVKRVF